MRSGGLAIGGAVVLGAAWLFAQRDAAVQTAPPASLGKAAVSAVRLRLSSRRAEVLADVDRAATDDTTALARMLASETSDFGCRVVVGWVAVQRARRSKRSMYSLLTGGYGPQKRGSAYASTRKPPTVDTMRMAADLLADRLQPSAAIREVGPGSWVERKQDVPDSRIVELQKGWNEGAWARLRSAGRLTNWILYSAKKPVLAIPAGGTAASLLDGLPIVDAVDYSESGIDPRNRVT